MRKCLKVWFDFWTVFVDNRVGGESGGLNQDGQDEKGYPG
jgi:hypothetical protein